jgi:methanogenic corrinoid protein MtbC1
VGVDDEVMRAHREHYLDLAGDLRVDDAVELCLQLLNRGTGPQDITLGLLQPALHEVGRRWALGSWAVAQEHAASAVTDAALAALSAAVPARPSGEPVLVACPETEWHGLAAQMVTQLLRWRGVAADYVGTLASEAALEELLADRRPRAVALSCTMTSALPGVARAATVAARQRIAVLGGGAGFGPQGRYARAVGVNAWDACVSQAVRRLARWETTVQPEHCHVVPETIAYRRLLRHHHAIAEELADRLANPVLAPDEADALRDAARQTVALALAAAYTGHHSILDDGIHELVAVLGARPGPISAVAARLPVAARAALGRHR